MKINGQSLVDAAPDAIWPLVFEPGALLQLLPGCEDVVQVAPGEYRARMTLRVPGIAGSYETWVKVLEIEEPRFCRIRGEASGPAGSVAGQASFSLQPQGQQTLIAYQGDAVMGGPLAGMNPRFSEGVAQTFIRQGLARLPELARARTAALEVAQLAASAAPTGRTRRWFSWLEARFAHLWRGLVRLANRVRPRGRA